MAIELLGIPIDFWAMGATVLIIGLVWYYKLAAEGTPVRVLYLRQNYSAIMLNAREQIGGTFVEAMKKGKPVLTVVKKGLPFELGFGGTKRQRTFIAVEGCAETVTLLDGNEGKATPSIDAVEKGKAQITKTGVKYETVNEATDATRGIINMIKEVNEDKIKTLMMPLLLGLFAGFVLSNLLGMFV